MINPEQAVQALQLAISRQLAEARGDDFLELYWASLYFGELLAWLRAEKVAPGRRPLDLPGLQAENRMMHAKSMMTQYGRKRS